ncbi:MAG: SurA N-terminal domain-containing protein [Pseudomonadota bacterium]
MLDSLRVFSKSWLAIVLIGLLVVSFAIWGISGSIIFGGQYTIVQVGDTEIDANEYRFAYENQLVTFSQSIGRRLSRQEADALGMRENVLTQVIAGAVLDENARKMGLGLSDQSVAEEIADDPRFRDLSGQFSRNGLRNSLAQAGMTENDYIQSRKRVSMRNQILDGTAASLAMPAAYIDALSTYRDETRVFEFVTLGTEVAGVIPDPSETDISSYYETNKTDFIAPPYRKVAILKLQPQDLMKPEEVTEEELQSLYENRRSNLRSPERRQVQQLVLGNKEAAEKVLQSLAEGATFEEVVAEQGKTIEDIDLGILRRDELPDEKVAAAAFEAKLNEPTEVIQGLFGPVIVRVAKIEEESTTPFEEIKETLRQEIAIERAVDDVFASYDAVEDERGAGESILPTGEKLELETRVLDAVDINGQDQYGNPISGIPQFRDLVAQAFQAQPGDDTQAIEIGENGFLWYEVLEIIPERQKTLDEVRDDVRSAWISAETDKAIKAVADQIVERLKLGGDFNAILAELLPTDSLGAAITTSRTDPLQRSGQSPDFPAAAVRAGFAEKTGAISTVGIGENQEIVYRISEVQAAGTDALEDEVTQQIDLAASQDILSQVVEHLQSREEVFVNRDAIDLAFNPYGGHGGHGGY